MRPIQHLPIKHPSEHDPFLENPNFFYENFVKHFIPDMIEMTNNGIPIDKEAVEDLRVTVDKVLASVDKRIKNNKIIKQYNEFKKPYLKKEQEKKYLEKTKTVEDYYKPYNHKNIVHRTYLMNLYLGKEEQKDKWTIADLKTLNIFKKDPFISSVIDKTIELDNNYVLEAMCNLAEDQVALWNKPREEKAYAEVEVPDFNVASAKQLQELFSMLEIEPLSVSKKTNNASWNRSNIEQLHKVTTDEDLLEVLDCIIDHSFSSIIKNNFINAFDNFTIDGVLYGNINLFGAKSFRPTSNSPNLLNMPSSGSIYASPLKRCFKAPEDYVIYTADLSALEDRVIANLSGDTNKQNIFLENLDGHSLNSCVYFADEIEKIMGKNTDNIEYVKRFYELVENKNKELSAIRFNSKAPTFKLAYGGYPDSHKGGVITQELFDNYHNVLYPGITDYRENYVLPFAEENGYIHLGLGCRMYCSDPHSDIRTINNATVQFWSILTLIALNETNYQIKQNNLEEDIKIISTIYDSIYFLVKKDAETIKWLNDNVIKNMCTPYLIDEVVHNEAEGEIGLNFADLNKVKNNASIKDIKKILNNL